MALPALAPPASLDISEPQGSKNISEGDDWIRYLQEVLKTYFAGIGGIVTATHTELNYVDGVTSAIQTQIDNLTAGIVAALGNAPLWVSGTTYAVPAVVYSPTDLLNYRKITASSVSTTDPQLDPTNWLCLNPPQGLQLLEVITATAAASADFDAQIDSTYEEYEIHFKNVVSATTMQVRVSTNGGSSYVAGTSYSYAYNASTSAGANAPAGGVSGSEISLGLVSSATVDHGGCSGVIRFFGPSSATTFKQFVFDGTYGGSATSLARVAGSGAYLATTAINAVRVMPNSGTFTGEFRLYGVKKTV